MFVATRYELEEQIRGVLIERDIANLVTDQHAVATQLEAPRVSCHHFVGGLTG